VLVETRRAGMTPLYRPYSQLVYVTRGSDVRTVLVNGRIVVRDGEITTVDEDEVMEKARGFADQIREVVARVKAGR